MITAFRTDTVVAVSAHANAIVAKKFSVAPAALAI